MDDMTLARMIAQKVSEYGGRAYFVGGYVRDRLMGKPSGDVDVEVHGISKDALEKILSGFGVLRYIGKSFGVYGIDGHFLDIALPRREKKSGAGHRDFEISPDENIGTYDACRRRDFTVNAIMEDILSGKLVDHFSGVSDIEARRLKHIDDESFVEDPLRVFRLARFSAQLDFSCDASTVDLCKNVDTSALSRERVFEETKKALLFSKKPSRYFECLRDTGALKIWFPELFSLIDVKQDPKYHPEGDVFVHTMQVIDRAAMYLECVSEPLYFMLSAVCHDFGKAVATTHGENGAIHAYGHEKLGLPLVESFLKRLTNEKRLKKYVLCMTYLHMKPNILAQCKAHEKSTNRMFDDASCALDLIYLSVADMGDALLCKSDYALFLFERLEKYNEVMSRPYVTGEDLISNGIAPGEDFSDILAFSHKMRLAGVEKKSALACTLSYARKKRKKEQKREKN